jgi:hypothetical protein
MPTLDSLFSDRELSATIDAGHVTRTQNPRLGLPLDAYTRLRQYEHADSRTRTLNDLLRQARRADAAIPYGVAGRHHQQRLTLR